ncbi:MAG TPA: hypothetical protein VEV81_00205, partial [Pyrinomonadaceae bacterium]|nr:hypothetical protein [Pyrinomonadaceae bacterium]
GLPLLGLIPVLGRLFTSPTRNNNQIDIVIAVTPRVLRAPAITPEDEKQRDSGTLQTPANSSLEAMVQEADREEQLAAARRIPNNVAVQLPDAEPVPAYVPAPKALVNADNGASATAPSAAALKTERTTPTVQPVALTNGGAQSANALANAIAQLTGEEPPVPTALVEKKVAAATPSTSNAQPSGPKFMPMPVPSLVAASLGGKNEGSTKNQERAQNSSIGEKLKAGLLEKPNTPPEPQGLSAEARLVPVEQEMHVGARQRVALVLVSKESLGNTIMRLRFDPHTLAVRSVAQGAWAGEAQTAPTIMQSIDPAGVVTVAVSPQMGAPLKAGANVVLYFEVEALANGESLLSLDPASVQLFTADGRAVKLQMVESRVTVK